MLTGNEAEPFKGENVEGEPSEKVQEEGPNENVQKVEELGSIKEDTTEKIEGEVVEVAETIVQKDDVNEEFFGGDEEFVVGDLSIEDALNHFQTSKDGLSAEEAKKRIEQYGPNALPEVSENKCLKFLSFMWNPLSWVMEVAALVALVLDNGPTPWVIGNPFGLSDPLPPDWYDFLGIVALLLINSAIGYYEESQAGDAVAALMDQLSPECTAKRDGQWQTIAAKDLVPGDIVTIKLGDIIPADLKLLNGEDLKVDQSGLTGESLPVTKSPGDEVFSGSVVKRGEIDALVHATGVNTFFGKAANLVATTEEHGHLQDVLRQIGNFCLAYISIWILILVIVLPAAYQWYYRGIISVILVVLIGGIPIAMPTVLSVTLALGVNQLAKKQAIVTRITAIEEMAGMDVLCSDKTGTLTLNQLTVDTPSTCGEFKAAEIIRIGALAAKREGDPDAIDKCIADAAVNQGLNMTEYEETKFIPFNPTDKRTEARLVHKENGSILYASKGAPQVMIDLAYNADEIREEQEKIINDFALRGLRAIGVASKNGDDGNWEFMGLIPLLDPPRHDTKKTIDAAIRLGVSIKMITGDQVAIGKETALRLGMGVNFHNAAVVRSEFVEGIPVTDIIEEADGFGEVFPEDKYAVVQTLRSIKKGPFGGPHVVGMTGDGVNDAPALKAADVGIAVADATDAARAAADMVLLTPGLHVIIDAIIGSRKVFQRMKNYAVYACATTVRIVSTFSIMAAVWQFSFPPFLVLIIAFLNDGTILTISKDRVQPSPTPDAWRLKEIFTMGFVIGAWLTVSTIVFFAVILNTTWFEDTFNLPTEFRLVKNDDICNYLQISGNTIKNGDPYDPTNDCLYAYQETYGYNTIGSITNGVIYLQVSITGQLVIFSTRARLFFFQNRPSYYLLGSFIFAQVIATILAVYADFGVVATLKPIGWGWAAIVWVWSLVWYIPVDIVKIATSALFHGNPWKAATANSQMLNLAINGGASHLSSRGSHRASNSRAYAARISRQRASKLR